MAAISVPESANMRDIFDICKQHGIPSLAQGMIEFPPPQKLREIAAKTVMDPSVHTYRNRMGEGEYREALAGMVHKVYGEDVTPDCVLGVAGVAGGVSAALLALRARNPDATVALLEPYYTFHSAEVERAFGRMPVVIGSVGDSADPNFSELRRRVAAGEVHGVIATNPVNPTGRAWTPEEVAEVLELVDTYDLFAIFDECYLDMVFNGCKHASPLLRGVHRNVVCCRGFSKCLGCQSWRCGYAISAPETLQEMMRMMDPLYICVNWTQHALAEYFKTSTDDFQAHSEELSVLLQDNWRLLSVAFQRCFGWEPLQPNGTMYGMFKHSDESDLKAVERALKAGVGICPGSMFFGDPKDTPKATGWVRIHCGVTREKAQAIATALGNYADAAPPVSRVSRL